jgi:hypothetical protein
LAVGTGLAGAAGAVAAGLLSAGAAGLAVGLGKALGEGAGRLAGVEAAGVAVGEGKAAGRPEAELGAAGLGAGLAAGALVAEATGEGGSRRTHVSVPTMPSGCNPAAFWKAATALAVLS